VDLFAKKNPERERHTQEIRKKITDLLGLPPEATVMVTELNCQDEDCPEVETVIAIFQPGLERFQATLHASSDEISDSEIESVCRNFRNIMNGANEQLPNQSA
jgi:hypothetical protein